MRDQREMKCRVCRREKGYMCRSMPKSRKNAGVTSDTGSRGYEVRYSQVNNAVSRSRVKSRTTIL